MLRGRTVRAAAAVAAHCMGMLGCGDSEPEPSIPRDDAESLVQSLSEIQANADEGSCLVAQRETDEFLAAVNELPDDVDQDVRNALAEGGNNLKQLLDDPDQCERPTETETETEPTTTEETTTEETETTETQTQTQPTTTTQTTTPTQPPPGGGGSGGVGPGGVGGGP